MAADNAMMGMDAATESLPMAIGKLFLMFGDEQNKNKMKLPPLPKNRVPGAKGLDVDWKKVAEAIYMNSQIQES